VNVRDGLTDLFVFAGPPLTVCRGEVLGVLRQLGATKVHMPKKREPVPCFALYSLDTTHALYHTTGTGQVVSGDTMGTVRMLEDSHLCFTLT